MSIGAEISAGWQKIKNKLSGEKETPEEVMTPEEPEVVPLAFTPEYVPPAPEQSRSTEEYLAWAARQRGEAPPAPGRYVSGGPAYGGPAEEG